jgi:hypothetical protein
LRALLGHHTLLLDQPQDCGGERLGELLRDSGVRAFIHIHVSDGQEWFNRERFEDLIGWLFLTAAVPVEETGMEGRPAVERLFRLHDAAQCLIRDAEKAGYRPDVLLETYARTV